MYPSTYYSLYIRGSFPTPISIPPLSPYNAAKLMSATLSVLTRSQHFGAQSLLARLQRWWHTRTWSLFWYGFVVVHDDT